MKEILARLRYLLWTKFGWFPKMITIYKQGTETFCGEEIKTDAPTGFYMNSYSGQFAIGLWDSQGGWSECITNSDKIRILEDKMKSGEYYLKENK